VPEKLGLALSGGGHRAAFFHIGTLARFAELGLLRKVEVISTVSGGSLVGCLYYLRVKQILEDNADGTITDAHFVEAVRDVEKVYRAAMARNLRGRAVSNYFYNFRMVRLDTTRTDLIADVLERDFYNPQLVGDPPFHMENLRITPKNAAGESYEYDPDDETAAARDTPVPILLLNATTLNNGHSFRFEATHFGEALFQWATQADVDKNLRLARRPYACLPAERRHFRLGVAVAASAAFPGGLAPKPLPHYYSDEDGNPWIVQLSDGGVRDNQGIDGLLDMGCSRLIVSDGAAQLDDVAEPAARIPAVLMRAASIEGTESREQRILRAMAAHPTAFMHLLTGMQTGAVKLDGDTCADKPETPPPPLDVGIGREAQASIARMRTDLDAFSDVEASSVMLAGYKIATGVMTDEGGCPKPILDLIAHPDAPAGEWRFSAVDRWIDGDDEWYLRRLAVAQQRFLKPLFLLFSLVARPAQKRVGPSKRYLIGATVGAAAAGGLSYLGVRLGSNAISAQATYAVGVGLTLFGFLYLSANLPGFRRLNRFIFDCIVPAVGAVSGLLFAFGWTGIWSGRLHRRLGRDGGSY
jgi:predicted acylesterase/phospholipase RssA